MNKHTSRLRRSQKAKRIIAKSNRPRVVVYRSSQHTYAQIVTPSENGDMVLVSCSTIDKELKGTLAGKKKSEQASLVGALLAKRAVGKGIAEVAFDRAGYKYHGRVKALAEAAREHGLNF